MENDTKNVRIVASRKLLKGTLAGSCEQKSVEDGKQLLD